MHGEVYRITMPKGRGHEQRGQRFAVVVQSTDLPLSTWVVCPTSTAARAARFRPEVDFGQGVTRVMVDQVMAVDPQRLGERVAVLSLGQLQALDDALRIVLDLLGRKVRTGFLLDRMNQDPLASETKII